MPEIGLTNFTPWSHPRLAQIAAWIAAGNPYPSPSRWPNSAADDWGLPDPPDSIRRFWGARYVQYHTGPPGPDGFDNLAPFDVYESTEPLDDPVRPKRAAARAAVRPARPIFAPGVVAHAAEYPARYQRLFSESAVITHLSVWANPRLTDHPPGRQHAIYSDRGTFFQWSAELATPVVVDPGAVLILDTAGVLDVIPAAPGDPTYVPVASTYPVGVFADWGIGFEVTSGAIIRDVAVGSGEGNFYGGGVYLTPMSTLRHRAIVTAANVVGLPNNRGVGCGVHGSDDEFTDGVFCTVDSAAASNPPSCELFVKAGASITAVASSNDDTDNNTKIELRPSLSGGVWTYTVFKDGAASCAWTDSEHVVTPGVFTCFAFQHRRASGVELFSDGIRDFTAQDY